MKLLYNLTLSSKHSQTLCKGFHFHYKVFIIDFSISVNSMSRATTSAAEVRRVSRSVDEAGAASDSAMVLGPNREVMNVVMRNADDTADVMLYSDNDEGVDLDDEILPPAKPLFPEHHKYSPTVYQIQKGQLVPMKGFTMLDVEAAAKHARESVYDPHTSQSHNIQTHHSPFFLPEQTNKSENNFHLNDTRKQEPLMHRFTEASVNAQAFVPKGKEHVRFAPEHSEPEVQSPSHVTVPQLPQQSPHASPELIPAKSLRPASPEPASLPKVEIEDVQAILNALSPGQTSDSSLIVGTVTLRIQHNHIKDIIRQIRRAVAVRILATETLNMAHTIATPVRVGKYGNFCMDAQQLDSFLTQLQHTHLTQHCT
jgi:hypothetical protein